jgi:hypothetical protein
MNTIYKVVKYFEDLQDGGHPYNVGDTYPREGFEPTEVRIKELSTPFNLQKTILIEKEKPVKRTLKDSEE